MKTMLLAGFRSPMRIFLGSAKAREDYRVFFQTFYDGAEEIRYLREVNKLDTTTNRLQTGLLELPYEVQENLLPSAYYDDLPEDAEPAWMRMEALNLAILTACKDMK